ncbi:hypothetical protein Ancab_025462 [Ancistrocladus abbreviatus]
MHKGLQPTTQTNSHLRSFVCWTPLSYFDTPVHENFRFLRVLHIAQDIKREEVIGGLIFLRYLKINMAAVPRSLGNLHRLLILDIRGG